MPEKLSISESYEATPYNLLYHLKRAIFILIDMQLNV